jgi:hypothetical protein
MSVISSGMPFRISPPMTTMQSSEANSDIIGRDKIPGTSNAWTSPCRIRIRVIGRDKEAGTVTHGVQ